MAALALVLTLLVVSYAYPLRAFVQQRGLLADARSEEAALLARVDHLQAERERWEDPAYIRSQARERLNFVLAGEVGLVVVGTEDVIPPEQQSGPVVPENRAGSEWWLRLWAGVVAAGTAQPGARGPGRAAEAPADQAPSD